MKTLGIGISHDSGIVLVEDGKILFGINEERLDRIKLSSGFPVDSINYLKNVLKVSPNEIDAICIGGRFGMFIESHTKLGELVKELDATPHRGFIAGSQTLLAPIYRSRIGTFLFRTFGPYMYGDRIERTLQLIKDAGFSCPVVFYDHHLCHAASAVFSAPRRIFEEKSLVITSDAAGDGFSTGVYMAEKGKITRIHEVNQYNSLAMLYSYVTELCGFTPFKHEGKITGLAAHGKPIYYKIFEKMISYEDGNFYNMLGKQHKPAKDFILQSIGKKQDELTMEDKANLSASVQQHLEDKMTSFMSYWMNKTGIRNVLTAGGIFANVKLNQRVWELPNLDFFFVHQNMGDGGIPFGAATLHSFRHTGKYVEPPTNVYFGPEYSDSEIKAALDKHGVKYKRYNDVEKAIAKLLAKDKVVSRFNGRMEYGPRALGNRTMLFTTTDKTVNDWLNKKLNRTEFMPFAPVTLAEHAQACYGDLSGAEYAARFMTITFNCTPEMKKKSPAVVHIDNTARPQLVDKDYNPSYRKILEEYYKLTKIPSLINTSFNMHEEPIVCSPEDAVRSFLNGNVGYLAIGNYIADEVKVKKR